MTGPSWLELDAAAFDADAVDQLTLDIPDAEIAATMAGDDGSGTMSLGLEWG